ncbi:uncharacterized protein [Venturia canescens]|uniref:uncharacterized protein n=1 Tax=Venturia canescens TaxID=32260 RepID=UPI001C9CA380|nr:uncharacterized protein LOC122413209 [Venturia canescens]
MRKLGQANITAGTIQTRLTTLDRYWEKFEAQHETLLSQHGNEIEELEYKTQDLASTVEEIYMNQRGILLDYISELPHQPNHTISQQRRDSPQARTSLPRIQLPSFNGEYEDWPRFRDLFLSMIGNDNHLHDVEKLHYLKSTVKGEAEATIKNIPITAENYQRAWQSLANVYENKRLLVSSCLTKFSHQPKMTAETTAELKRVFHSMVTTVNVLEGIGRPIDSSEDLFVFSVTELLDPRTRREWESAINDSKETPTYETLKTFLEKRLQMLEALNPSASSSSSKGNHPRKTKTHCTQAKKYNECLSCKQSHFILICPDYKGKDAAQRLRFIEQKNACVNCLGRHKVAECKNPKVCNTCSEKHHTTLHEALHRNEPAPRSAITSHVIGQVDDQHAPVLLATARVLVKDKNGQEHCIRALIDQGSEVSLATERLIQKLHLPRKRSNHVICGVGGLDAGRSRGKTTIEMHAKRFNRHLKANVLILHEITTYSGQIKTLNSTWKHVANLPLADPSFFKSDTIDLLLGADVYSSIILRGLRKGSRLEPVAHETIFGWILTGIAGQNKNHSSTTTLHIRQAEDLTHLVRKFWEQEEISSNSITNEESQCEADFASSHSRQKDGRYMVRLPLLQHPPDLSSSRKGAASALASTEKRFKGNAKFEALYREFMLTYEQMKHMSEVSPTESNPTDACYLPHHGVWRESSSTTKLRVVFNGSWRTSTGKALNDYLNPGMNLLPALSDILLKWRKHQFVIAADIEKMYRQILVHPDDRPRQRILWRHDSSQEIKEYQLNTVTYGLACAPFLALRCIKQLADDEQNNFPRGSRALRDAIYVDDILTGADNITELAALKQELIGICKAGGFPLRKWVSNSAELLEAIPPQERANAASLQWMPNESIHQTLGLKWDPVDDSFAYTVKISDQDNPTKRSILSATAQLFDPLGWITPVTTRAKITIQSTWLLNVQWDDHLPATLTQDWKAFYAQWPNLANIRISRPLWDRNATDLEIHGFSDASERAYAAVVYIRTTSTTGDPKITLVAAKSKVAPLKQVSLPRLELCGAQLLVKLVHHTKTTLNQEVKIHLWTDSTIVLGWIQGHPTRWTTYVANRVSEIQIQLPEASWHHISGKENPADCASRGISPSELLQHPLWWTGPAFLRHRASSWASGEFIESRELPETRYHTLTTTAPLQIKINPLLKQFSNYNRLLRVSAWCRRWTSKVRARKTNDPTTAGPLTAMELEATELLWIKNTQASHFQHELHQIRSGQNIKTKSQLIRLTPFIDHDGVLRTGGRLRHANMPYSGKHPIILPPHSRFTELLTEATHRRMLHGGTQLTLAAIRQRFWIPQGRRVTKTIIHRCPTCVRWKGTTQTQQMANLPKQRVTQARPFQYSGVDYAGPIHLKTAPGRGRKSMKGFIAIFVCLSTRAIHLDAASDYSSEAFLAVLRRFISRRGPCSEI